MSVPVRIFLLIVALSACQTKNPRPQSSPSNPEEDFFQLLDPQTKTLQDAQNKAALAKKEGNLDRALFYSVKILQLDPQNVPAMLDIAAIHQQQNHNDLAGKIYADILKIEPNQPLANEFIGLKKLKERQIEEAAAMLTKAVQHAPDRWQSHNGLGIIADLKQNYTAAIAHYQNALKVNPRHVMLLNNIGYSYYLKGDTDLARDYFYQALKINEKHQRAIFNLALLEVKSQDLLAAVALFGRIMPIYEAYNNVGYLCMKNGQYEDAETYFKNAIQSSPYYFPKAQQNLKQLAKLKTQSAPIESPPAVDVPAVAPVAAPVLPPAKTPPIIPKATHSQTAKTNAPQTADDSKPSSASESALEVSQKQLESPTLPANDNQAKPSISSQAQVVQQSATLNESVPIVPPATETESNPPSAPELSQDKSTDLSISSEAIPIDAASTTTNTDTPVAEIPLILDTESSKDEVIDAENGKQAPTHPTEDLIETIQPEDSTCPDPALPCQKTVVPDAELSESLPSSVFDQTRPIAPSTPLIQSTEEILQNLKHKMAQDYGPLKFKNQLSTPEP